MDFNNINISVALLTLGAILLLILNIICEISRRNLLKEYKWLKMELASEEEYSEEAVKHNTELIEEKKETEKAFKHTLELLEATTKTLENLKKQNTYLKKHHDYVKDKVEEINILLEGNIIAFYYKDEESPITISNKFTVDGTKVFVEEIIPAKGKGTKKQVNQIQATLGFEIDNEVLSLYELSDYILDLKNRSIY